jgi:hypothetical protein
MARLLTIVGKVDDRCNARLEGDGERKEHEGYVPRIEGIGNGGDYIRLVIDIDTGKIVGWKTPSKLTLDDVFEPIVT